MKSNREALIRPEMKCLTTMLGVIRLALSVDPEQLQGPVGSPSMIEQFLQVKRLLSLRE